MRVRAARSMMGAVSLSAPEPPAEHPPPRTPRVEPARVLAGSEAAPEPASSATPEFRVKWFHRFHVRLTLALGGVVFLMLTAMAVLFYQFGYDAALGGLQDKLRATVTTLALNIDVPALAALSPEGAPDSPEVRDLARRFEAVATTDKDISTIYALRKTDTPGHLRFIVDYAVEGRSGKPGQAYDATKLPRMLEGLDQVAVESQVWADEFGPSLSGYAPLRLPSGESIGLVGLDVDAARVHEMQERVLTTTLVLYGITGLLMVLLALWTGRRIRGPLAEINRAAGRIAAGDFVGRVQDTRRDEFGMVARHFDVIAESLQERDFIRDTFGRYVSAEVARKVLGDRTKMALGGEEREATILFSDIQGYSTMNEKIDPQEMIGVLNSYLGAMNEVIDAHDGVVIEFIGDAILCVFNTPNDVNEHAERAVRCALAMRERLVELNAEWDDTRVGDVWRESGHGALTTRVGIHTGTVVAGNIGSRTRMKYGVLGDVVNVAARLEQMNKQTKTTILVSQATFERLHDDLKAAAMPQGKHVLRGRETAVGVYAL
ncbi:MAG: HAMP domain-containing protein [Deltaproteobacteria bacterium]|nr:MAG: HAMP domain-containing protein [Deltaproteobacteria bacterium]